MTIRFEVYGVQEAVSQLRKYDRDMYQTIIKDLKDNGAPLAARLVQRSLVNRFAVKATGTQQATGKASQRYLHTTVLRFGQV